MRGRGYVRRGKARGVGSQVTPAELGAGYSSFPAPPSPSPKKRRASPEADFQIQAVSLLRLMLPEPCRVWFVPNGGNLSEAQAAKFQKMGLLAGVHDVHVMVPGGFYTLECKAGRGKLSAEQADFGEAVRACGHGWQEIRTLADVYDWAMAVAHEHGFACRRVQLGPAGFVWARGE